MIVRVSFCSCDLVTHLTFICLLTIDDEVKAHLLILDVNVGRVNATQTRLTSYYYGKKPGCTKASRVVELCNLPEDYANPLFFLEHDEREEHDHTAEDLNL